MAALGERFRVAREARGLTLPEVSEQTRIRSVYLAAIEEEQWERIGAAVYVRGFIRTYGAFLKLDVEEALREYASSSSVSRAADESEAYDEEGGGVPPAAARKTLAPWLWAAGVVAVLLIAFLTYSLTSSAPPSVSVAVESPTASPGVSPSPGVRPSPGVSPSPGASPSSASITPGQGTLILRLAGTSWLRVTVDGNVSMVGTFPAGTQRAFRGKDVTVRVGNAAAVTFNVDGKNVGPLGGAGVVVERTFTL